MMARMRTEWLLGPQRRKDASVLSEENQDTLALTDNIKTRKERPTSVQHGGRYAPECRFRGWKRKRLFLMGVWVVGGFTFLYSFKKYSPLFWPASPLPDSVIEPWPVQGLDGYKVVYNPGVADELNVFVRVRASSTDHEWDNSLRSSILWLQRPNTNSSLWKPRLEVVGTQDPRAVWVDGSLLITFSSFDSIHKRIYIGIQNCSDTTPMDRILPFQQTRLLPPPGGGSKEKNWQPFVHHQDGTLYFARFQEPHQILSCHEKTKDTSKQRQCRQVYSTSSRSLWPSHFYPHGGSPPLYIPERNLYLATCNGRNWVTSVASKVYSHVFYTFQGTPPFAVQAVSVPFRFRRVWHFTLQNGVTHVEFVTGLYRYNATHVAVCFGLDNQTPHRVLLAMEVVWKRLLE